MKLIEAFGDRVKAGEPMNKHTTYRIGGRADFYLEVKNKEEVLTAFAAAKTDGQPVFVLGGGSNVLVSDAGFRGLVLVSALRAMEITPERVYVEAGVNAMLFARLAAEAGLAGLEWSAGLPGTVGGAIRGNAGAYGSCYGNVIAAVDVYDPAGGQTLTISNADCRFAYRESVFKKNPYYILGARFNLVPGDKGALIGKMGEIISLRNGKLPAGVLSAGSVFKNHHFASLDELSPRIRERLPEQFAGWKTVPAAWLIDLLDLKGKTIGQAQISTEHANYFINLGGATAEQVIELISYAKMKVRDELGIQLKEEIEYVGF